LCVDLEFIRLEPRIEIAFRNSSAKALLEFLCRGFVIPHCVLKQSWPLLGEQKGSAQANQSPICSRDDQRCDCRATYDQNDAFAAHVSHRRTL